tara:strand:+ start:889 stop:1200 length:312 start_codon:yes stop_codon:yes gene_type:complete
MSIISFLQENNRNHYFFPKNEFKYMYISYSSGTTGSVYIYFQAEGTLNDHDLITLTVREDKLSYVSNQIKAMLSSSGNNEITTKTIENNMLHQFIDTITYTAG